MCAYGVRSLKSKVVRADKLREVREGHDGTWVAHTGLVGIAKRIYDEGMSGPNQLDRLRDDVSDNALAMLEAPCGPRTEAGLRHNIRVASSTSRRGSAARARFRSTT